MSRPLRALALHGFRMNGSMLESMLEDVRATFGARVDWTFLDAPHPARGRPSPFVAQHWPDEPSFEWWNAEPIGGDSFVYQGAERSLAFVEERLSASGPFDLVAGYSQGAVVAALVTARALADAERGRRAFGERPWQALLFNIGPPPRDPSLGRLLTRPLDAPSVHVVGGKRDFVYPLHPAVLALWRERGRQVVEHAEGHMPPTARESPDALERLRTVVPCSGEEAPR